MKVLKWLTHPGVLPAVARLLLALAAALAATGDAQAASAALLVAPLELLVRKP